MQTVAQDAVKDTTGRNESFPSFVAKQYEFFHYIEICECDNCQEWFEKSMLTMTKEGYICESCLEELEEEE